MLLAEELAVVALNPESGRHAVGVRSELNACLAGLLVAELLLDGRAEPHETDGVVVEAGGAASNSSTLEAAADVAGAAAAVIAVTSS